MLYLAAESQRPLISSGLPNCLQIVATVMLYLRHSYESAAPACKDGLLPGQRLRLDFATSRSPGLQHGSVRSRCLQNDRVRDARGSGLPCRKLFRIRGALRRQRQFALVEDEGRKGARMKHGAVSAPRIRNAAVDAPRWGGRLEMGRYEAAAVA